MKVSNNAFELARPVLQPMNLKDSSAAYCRDCCATTSGLDPLRSALAVAPGFAGARSVYRRGDALIPLLRDYAIVPSPVIQDIYQRLFATDSDGGLIQASLLPGENDIGPNGLIVGRRLSDLNMPIDAPQPMAELGQTNEFGVFVPTDMDGVVPEKAASFLVTFVSDRGEETAGSPASEPIGYIDSDDYAIRLSFLPVSDYEFVASRRLYMSVGGEFHLLRTLAPVGDSYVINPFDDDRVSDVYSTGDFSPPLPGLRGLVGLSSGSLAGYVNDGDTGSVCVSEPYQPHAWPVGYRFKTYDPVVALAVVPEGVLVLTAGRPMIIIGDSPDVMSPQVIESTEGCVSARSVMVVNGVCYWACPDGIAAFGGGQIQVISRATWSREQWQALEPASMLFAWYEGHVLIYAQDSAWLYSLARHDVSELSESAVTAVLSDTNDDRLYVVRGDELLAFNEGDYLPAQWRSKDYMLSGGAVLNSGRIDADAYPVQLILSAANATGQFSEAVDRTVNDNRLFRIASIGRKRLMHYELRPTGRVRTVQLASGADLIE